MRRHLYWLSTNSDTPGEAAWLERRKIASKALAC
jgi:hypothetical protein